MADSEKSAVLQQHVDLLCEQARPAAQMIAVAKNELRQAALESAAKAIETASDDILTANSKDMAQAEKMNLSTALRDRLLLDPQRLANVVADLRGVIAQADPVGRRLEERTINDGITLEKIAVPIGVVAIIFESRPNVTVDAAALCLRSGNACILRGGKEAVHSNNAFIKAIRHGLEQAGVNANTVQLVQEQDRELIP
ncbi:MAG: aldehyde dehydrogenase family protein, partial [Planctomycetes bacterium]|nr:aldehyde dehydrogenase family protein [Planctomycetota bacterium]